MADTPLLRWLDDIAEYLRQHGPTELGELAQPHAAPRPTGVPPGNLKVGDCNLDPSGSRSRLMTAPVTPCTCRAHSHGKLT